MASKQVSVRVNTAQLRRAKKLLAARSTSEVIQAALQLVTEKALHDKVVRRFSGHGSRHAFREG
jgi:Arc/MetJ-type ribon-helix-helix transcriptional regulator